MIGLDYISVLLQKPGRPFRALELQQVAGGQIRGDRVANSIISEASPENTFREAGPFSAQCDFSREDVIDERARHQNEKRLSELEMEITRRAEIGDYLKIADYAGEDLDC
jgi:hypothetical protein